MKFPREDVGRGGMWDVGSCAHPMPREVDSNDEAHARRSVNDISAVDLFWPTLRSSGWWWWRRRM